MRECVRRKVTKKKKEKNRVKKKEKNRVKNRKKKKKKKKGVIYFARTSPVREKATTTAVFKITI